MVRLGNCWIALLYIAWVGNQLYQLKKDLGKLWNGIKKMQNNLTELTKIDPDVKEVVTNYL